MLSKRSVLLAVLLGLFVASGCGSSDSSTVSKADFVRQADAICKRGEESKNADLKAAMKKLGDEGGTLTPLIEEGLVTNVALPPIRQMIEELAELPSPAGEAEEARAMIRAFEREIAKLEKNPSSVITGSGGSFDRANQVAKQFGMANCAAI